MLRREFIKASVGASAAFAAEKTKQAKGELPSSAYAVVEMMGHKRLAGRLSHSPVPGLLQLDVPAKGGFITQLINPSAIYRVTITDEQSVRELACEDPLPPVCIEDSGYRQLSLDEHEGPPF